VHALYGAGSSMQRVDLGVRPYLVLALRAGMDDMGRVVVVWTESVPKEEIAGMQGWMRGSVQHLFYARYTPGVGWTSPVQIDGDDGKSLGATAVDFAVNDAGLAMLLWVGGPIVGNGNNLWVASLP